MSGGSPASLMLARRLRELREQWPDYRLTQSALAAVFGDVATATISSWENPATPKLAPTSRLKIYAQFFATRRSLEGERPALQSLETFNDEERAACKALEEELLGLHEESRKPRYRTEFSMRRSWHFLDSGPLTIVCAQLPVEPTSSFADLADRTTRSCSRSLIRMRSWNCTVIFVPKIRL